MHFYTDQAPLACPIQGVPRISGIMVEPDSSVDITKFIVKKLVGHVSAASRPQPGQHYDVESPLHQDIGRLVKPGQCFKFSETRAIDNSSKIVPQSTGKVFLERLGTYPDWQILF